MLSIIASPVAKSEQGPAALAAVEPVQPVAAPSDSAQASSFNDWQLNEQEWANVARELDAGGLY